MVNTKTLKNGVRVIVKQMEGLLSVTMGVLVGTGAAYESDEEDGLSHFLEHMQFKGTDKHTAFELSDAFDALGAQVNAFTGKDLTCYYTKSTSDHAREAFSLLSEMFLKASFPEEEIVREKGVVIEEINMDEDSPEDLCLDLLCRAAFGNVGYGKNILGPIRNVEGFTRKQLLDYKARRYRPDNIVVSFAGNIDPSLAMELAEKYFGDLKCEENIKEEIKVEFKYENLFRKKPIEQAHFALAFPTVERDHPALYATQIMNCILGGGMSSRLFKKVREELGLAYSVYSFTTHFCETGLFSIYAAVNPLKAESALNAVVSVIEEFKSGGVSEEEFLRGREQMRSSNIFSQENTSSQMLLYGKQMLYKNEVFDLEKRMDEIASLKREDVLGAIEMNFDFSKVSVSTVGNLERGVFPTR